ncbi:hypothetical protein WMY93_011907 [Mugilogobius chulae]|uniref:Contactin 4 n=1 Tax=Mugilogobius chulae TaxID=88201 RepID=A0AAW0P9Q7_9GOBI
MALKEELRREQEAKQQLLDKVQQLAKKKKRKCFSAIDSLAEHIMMRREAHALVWRIIWHVFAEMSAAVPMKGMSEPHVPVRWPSMSKSPLAVLPLSLEAIPSDRLNSDLYTAVQQSPMFSKQPGSIVYPVENVEKNREVVFSCEAQASPPPFYRWKLNGTEIKPGSHYSLSGGNLRISHLNRDQDAGTYQCLASNPFGTIVSREASLTFAYLEHFKTQRRSSVSVREGQGVVLLCGPPPHSGGVMGEYEPKIEVQFPEVVHVAKGSTVKLECFALGNPVPSITWRRTDGVPFPRKVDMRKASGVLEIPYFQQEDAGTYECVAENSRGMNTVKGKLSFYAPPHLTDKPQDVQKLIDDSLVWECKATGKPKPSFRWMKNGENMEPTEATIITSQPNTLDVTVGESVVLPCQVNHDPSLELKFTWFFNEQLIHFGSHGGFFEKVGGQHSAGDIMIRNIQLRHAGKYTCAVQTKVDSISIAVDLVVRGPPSPPTSINVEEITDTTASLSWRPGPDNHSPITAYTIQARTPFSLGWQAVTTVPEVVGGHRLTATVIDLSPWVEYEFRVLASNSIGTGEPSKPSKQARTKGTSPKVTPANVSGGGGSRSELVITWEPVPEELQNGPGFGYVVAFRPNGAPGWMQAAVPSAEASRYVFKNESIQPFSPFQVKVGVYNNEGEGPFGPVTTIYSAEEEPGRAPTRVRAKSLSASEVEVLWKALPWNASKKRVLGYELKYWIKGEKEDTANLQRTVGNQTSTIIRGLKGSATYYITVRAYNTAGTGPPSSTVNVTTKKPPPSQPPVKVMWNTSNSKIIVNWEQVKALDNESEVTGYKVFYKKNRHSSPHIMETNTTSVELALPTDEDYIIQIKPFGEGGEGSSTRQITIPRIPGPNAVGSASKVSTLSALSTIALSFTARTSL